MQPVPDPGSPSYSLPSGPSTVDHPRTPPNIIERRPRPVSIEYGGGSSAEKESKSRRSSQTYIRPTLQITIGSGSKNRRDKKYNRRSGSSTIASSGSSEVLIDSPRRHESPRAHSPRTVRPTSHYGEPSTATQGPPRQPPGGNRRPVASISPPPDNRRRRTPVEIHHGDAHETLDRSSEGERQRARDAERNTRENIEREEAEAEARIRNRGNYREDMRQHTRVAAAAEDRDRRRRHRDSQARADERAYFKEKEREPEPSRPRRRSSVHSKRPEFRPDLDETHQQMQRERMQAEQRQQQETMRQPYTPSNTYNPREGIDFGATTAPLAVRQPPRNEMGNRGGPPVSYYNAHAYNTREVVPTVRPGSSHGAPPTMASHGEQVLERARQQRAQDATMNLQEVYGTYPETNPGYGAPLQRRGSMSRRNSQSGGRPPYFQ